MHVVLSVAQVYGNSNFFDMPFAIPWLSNGYNFFCTSLIAFFYIHRNSKTNADLIETSNNSELAK